MLKNDLSSLFSRELVFANEDANDFKDLVNNLSLILEQKGYVKNSFRDALLEREANYPTGLQLNTTGVAIPHTDDIHVLKDAIVIIKLKEPITVMAMATENQEVHVKFVFMLLLKKECSHIDALQRLMDLFTDDSIMDKLKKENEAEELYNLVSCFMKKRIAD